MIKPAEPNDLFREAVVDALGSVARIDEGLLAILTVMVDNIGSWFTREEISKKTGLQPDPARRRLNALESHQLLAAQTRPRLGKKGRTPREFTLAAINPRKLADLGARGQLIGLVAPQREAWETGSLGQLIPQDNTRPVYKPPRRREISRLRKERSAVYLAALGTALRALREWRGMSALDLEARADIKRSMLCDYEQGTRVPALSTLADLCQALDVNLHEFLVQVFMASLTADQRPPAATVPNWDDRVRYLALLVFLGEPLDAMPYPALCCESYLACCCTRPCACVCNGCHCIVALTTSLQPPQ